MIRTYRSSFSLLFSLRCHFPHFQQSLDLLCDVDIVEPFEFAAAEAETSTAAVQLVANRTANTGDYYETDPNGIESDNNLNTTDRCCFLADPSLAKSKSEVIFTTKLLCTKLVNTSKFIE